MIDTAQDREQELALAEAYLICRNNIFWQFFIAEIKRKEEYFRQRLTQAAAWEEVCRLQGGLSVCQQLVALTESFGEEREHGF